MNVEPSPQEQQRMALDNYFKLSSILRTEMDALLDCEPETATWRRNFIRVSASLSEGHAHCLRELCAVSFKCSNVPKITKNETRVIESEKEFGAADRIKFTLRAAHNLFEITPAPNWNSKEWSDAQRLFKKRDDLMHPKTPADLEIGDTLWNEIPDGATWLMEQLFNFFSLLQKRYLVQPRLTPVSQASET